ncbi:hypothetical protein FISHEDRAFT_63225 [Fistulina hepatica ATCC 64428]|uniref:Fe2OG dioxygenase domain-containing protein n=1 Tax=Fistulina hepatica ATCC 64428 TaxID=1128425 RepID=A0A0D7ARC0_9AGAR|nr:hypothetical protein FISHEDRAFT_63225 [Fistulina hepatica ATCC 64428]
MSTSITPPSTLKIMTSVRDLSRSPPRHATLLHDDPISHFAPGLLNPEHVSRLRDAYAASEPYRYAYVRQLVKDDLLEAVKNECLRELVFTEKETDIYKVNQTGDLASLDFLGAPELARLPALLTLRNALYSDAFRSFVRDVTRCGPLSGSKQDMSVNSYRKGCHLLNHDDAIGTRRISYILYMPLPRGMPWLPEWGGALELYPVQAIGGEAPPLEPVVMPSKSILPLWGQFIFFEVKPGFSFHSVEEVTRLSISGWFHSPQEGEDGYEEEMQNQAREKARLESSRDQLTSCLSAPPSATFRYPVTSLTSAERAFLERFLNPSYLGARTLRELAQRFADESSLELHAFLREDVARMLESTLREQDVADGLDREARKVDDVLWVRPGSSWRVHGPPHKWRYCHVSSSSSLAQMSANVSAAAIMQILQDELFASPAFRAWLSLISRLLPLRYAVQARRFRPGLDYTLATSEANEARLDVVLGLTPDHSRRPETVEQCESGWESGTWGGWECYMAPTEGDDDPAVIHVPPPDSDMSSLVSERTTDDVQDSGLAAASDDLDPDIAMTQSDGSARDDSEAGGFMSGGDDDFEDGSTLLSVQPSFNRLLLVLRDEGVMRFVKYVSAAAPGSRWDVCGEFEVGMLEEDDE